LPLAEDTLEQAPTSIQWKVYPNPSAGRSKLWVASSSHSYRLRLINSLGQCSWEKQLPPSESDQPIELNFEAVEKGVYWLEICSQGACDRQLLQLY